MNKQVAPTISRYYRGRQGKRSAQMLMYAIENLWTNSVCEIAEKSIKGILICKLTIDNLTPEQFNSFYKVFNLNDGEIS